MGIRKEIKLVIKEYATCTVGANEAINAIANIVSRPKQKKLFPKQDPRVDASIPREVLDKPFKVNPCGEPIHFFTIIPLEDVPFPEITKEIFKKI